MGLFAGSLYDATYGNGLYLVAGSTNSGEIYSSEDAVQWREIDLGSAFTLYPFGFNSIAFGNGVFIVTGTGWDSQASKWKSFIGSSSDGINWRQDYEVEGESVLRKTLFVNDTFYVSGRGIYASVDGTSWSKISDTFGLEITYGYNTFAVIGSDGIYTSTDAITWTKHIIKAELANGFGGLAYGVGTFVAVGENETILQSDNLAYFDDVPPGHWAEGYINSIYLHSITTGCGEGNFCLDNNVTRGQMAAFIIRAKYGESFSYTTTPYFTDVPSTHTFFKYVQKLKDVGITAVSGTYGVDIYVTRGQMSAFIIRAKFGETFTYTQTPYFSDVPTTHTFFKYVQKLRDEGITAVTGTYGVDNIVTRAQMAAFLARAFLGMQ